jgi:hypothetical protein
VKVPLPLSTTLPLAGWVMVPGTMGPLSTSRFRGRLEPVVPAPLKLTVLPVKLTLPAPWMASVPVKVVTPLALTVRVPPVKASVVPAAAL